MTEQMHVGRPPDWALRRPKGWVQQCYQLAGAPVPDVIIVDQVIEHLDDPQVANVCAHELLSWGGALAAEPRCMCSWGPKLIRDRWWDGWHMPRNWRLFTEAT